MLYPVELRGRFRDRGRLRTGHLRSHVVPQAFAAKSERLTTRLGENPVRLLAEP